MGVIRTTLRPGQVALRLPYLAGVIVATILVFSVLVPHQSVGSVQFWHEEAALK